MLYNLNGKSIKIPDDEIQNYMKTLDLTQEQAIQMWLEDEEILINDEQAELTEKVKESGIMQTIHQAGDKKARKKPEKPKTVKVSDEKKEIFNEIYSNLADVFGNSIRIEKENKLIICEINGKTFKIDLIEQRKPKK